MNTDAQNTFWGLRFDLIASMGSTLAISMIILELNGYPQNLPEDLIYRIKRKYSTFDGQPQNNPDEIIDWIKMHFSTFESWHKKLVDISHSDSKSLTADQKRQWIIDVFDGIELVMSEANKLPQKTSVEGEENALFDVLMRSLQTTYERYNHLKDFLRQS